MSAITVVTVDVIVVVAVAVERNDVNDVFCRAVAGALMKRKISRVVTVAVAVDIAVGIVGKIKKLVGWM